MIRRGATAVVSRQIEDAPSNPEMSDTRILREKGTASDSDAYVVESSDHGRTKPTERKGFQCFFRVDVIQNVG
jgi:hypothetical protein